MMAKDPSRSLEPVVGAATYGVWTDMLAKLVPDGRTHRLAVVVAAMLRHAASRAFEAEGLEPRDGSPSHSLLVAQETPDPRRALGEISDLVERLFTDAGVPSRRVSARGETYSVVEAATREYVAWYDMPWE